MSDCPTSAQLESLLQEQLREPELTAVSVHLEDCAACQDTLHRLSAAGVGHFDFASALSDVTVVDAASEASELVARLRKRLKREPASLPAVSGYQLLEEIGRGAAGVVYRARHLELGRLVALKMILAGAHLSSESRGRLRREAQAIARLQHPGIIQIYSVGEADGCPYLALELVDGTNLARWMGGTPRAAREAAQIVAALAQAVEYAHQHGVIHRDLKPANILLPSNRTLEPDGSNPRQLDVKSLKIADFGLAKLLRAPGIADEEMTRTGAAIGTPAYVAPEQARGENETIGPTADVYSLGVILYELITGRPPFQGPSPIETLLQSAHHEPVAPMRLVPKVPRDLQTICLKCLEKSSSRRYASAAELAADLERFLAFEPIQARPVGRIEYATRWVRRHRRESAALAAVALLLAALLIGSLSAAAYFRKMEGEQHQLALEKGKLAEDKGRLADEKETERGKAVAAENREANLRQAAEVQGEDFRQNLYFARMNQAAQAALSPSGLARTREMLLPWQRILFRTDPADLREWEWYYLLGLCHRDQRTLSGHVTEVCDVAYAPGGGQLASAGTDGTVRIWDLQTGAAIVQFLGHEGKVSQVVWSPDGKRLASASADRTARVWTLDGSAEPLIFRGHVGSVFSVTWSPDATLLASGGTDRTLQVWSAVDGAIVTTIEAHDLPISSVACSPDGSMLATASHDMSIRLWRTDNWQPIRKLAGHVNWVNRIAWNHDGSLLASVSNDDSVKIWNPSESAAILSFHGHTEPPTSLAWSPDGAALATCSNDRTAKVWNVADGTERFTLRGHTSRVYGIDWSPNGEQIATAGSDSNIKLWSSTAGPETPVLRDPSERIDSLAWSADGQLLAAAGIDGSVRLWNPQTTETSEPKTVLVGHTDGVRSVVWDPLKKRLASGSSDGTVRIWNTATGESVHTLRGHVGEVFSVSWSPDGSRLASAGTDGTVRLWDPNTGRELDCRQAHEQWIHSVAWSPDGTRLACASWDKTISIWELPLERKRPLILAGHQNHITCVAWSPDGERLASGSMDQSLRLWKPETGSLLATFEGHTAAIRSIAWSPNGRRLASAGSDHTVKIWDPATGNEALSLSDHDKEGNAVAWRPDGLLLASAGSSHEIRLRDATKGYQTAGSPRYLPLLDRHIASNPRPDLLRERAQIHLMQGAQDAAAADAVGFLKLDPSCPWMVAGMWVAGPFPVDAAASIQRDSLGPRANGESEQLRPDLANLPHKLHPAHCQTVPLTADGFVDFGSRYGGAKNICADAMLYVYSPQRQPAAICFGSDDQALITLNGKTLCQIFETRAAVADSDIVLANLEVGWNRVVAHVDNVAGDHRLYLRLSNRPADLARAVGRQ